MNFLLDIKLIFLTILAIISKEKALIQISKIIESHGGDESLITLAQRKNPLRPMPPPGMSEIVSLR